LLGSFRGLLFGLLLGFRVLFLLILSDHASDYYFFFLSSSLSFSFLFQRNSHDHFELRVNVALATEIASLASEIGTSFALEDRSR
jgi:hypothetical protein